MLQYVLSGWCYESAIEDYMQRFNHKGEMIAIRCKDNTTIIVEFNSMLGPWNLTIHRTSKGCYVMINDALYVRNNDIWEFQCRI